jgi:tRNA A-37 threonylcarbamoyl transferase component Bud32
MKILREAWLEAEPLLSVGLELDAAARAAWLAGLEASHPAAAPVVRALIATHERAEGSRALETVSGLIPAPAWSSCHQPGARIGPFELIRLLGHGGMGEVWLARQADGRVEREVALKLPAVHLLGQTGRERFRRERDILARLNHPHIARLYDAGVTDGGQPWLAMEYVEGLSLLEHAQARSLSIGQRLALFRQVLAAVAHAHRHLVVHRDLKPANILIDTSGQVKLLDFGIAKLVDDGGEAAAAELTRLGGRVMTLRYAAPEQVAAGSITTATDVYALGVILHELVAGLSPYAAVREGKKLTEVMLMQQEPSLPSSLPIARPLARALSGDLDAIVLKALRRDPADRYASVEAFDQDILAHLEQRPVEARAGTWRYLAGRFAMRNRLPLAIAAALVASLAAGVAMVDQQRRVAVAERERAQRHFWSVRKLANTFIFDVHAEIEPLAGSLKAREKLVGTSLDYLEALARETGDDPALMHELAAGFMKIGTIQGLPGGANLGDLKAAQRNLERSKSLFAVLDSRAPRNIAVLRDHLRLSIMLARTYCIKADARWRAEIADSVKLAARVASLPGATLDDRARIAATLAEQAHLASIMSRGDPLVEASIDEAIALVEALHREAPDARSVREVLGIVYERVAAIRTGPGRTAQSIREGVAAQRRALEFTSGLAAAFPLEQRYSHRVAHELAELADALGLAGELEEAETTIQRALAANATLQAGDPANAIHAQARVDALASGTRIAVRRGDESKALARGEEALALLASMPEQVRSTRDMRYATANARSHFGLALLMAASDRRRDRGARMNLLLRAKSHLSAGVAFSAEAAAQGLVVIPEGDVSERELALRHCNEAIERLARG